MARSKSSILPPKRVGRPPKGFASPEKVRKYKARIVELLDSGECNTPTQAAQKLGISPSRVYLWMKHDEEWAEQVRLAENVLLDYLINQLIADKNPISKMFLIKGRRSEYRDSTKLEIKDRRTEQFLEELRKLGQRVREDVFEQPVTLPQPPKVQVLQEVQLELPLPLQPEIVEGVPVGE